MVVEEHLSEMTSILPVVSDLQGLLTPVTLVKVILEASMCTEKSALDRARFRKKNKQV